MSDFLQRAFRFYQGIGYTPAQAAAMAGNAQWESGGGNPLAVGDNGKSRGLFQWDANRYAGLQSFAKERDLDPKAEATQLAYADYELRNGEKKAGDKFFAATDLAGAHDALMDYLRPQGSENSPQGSAGYANRYNLAASLVNAPNMATALAMGPSQSIGLLGQPAMQQPDAGPTSLDPAKMPSVSSIDAVIANANKPLMGLLSNNMALQGGQGLLAAGAPHALWEPSALPTLQPHLGNMQALQLLPGYQRRGLLG